MDTTNALGEFLRARRDLVRPEVAGLPGGTGRRVAGLRREEVAILAGISSDYYLRLEQAVTATRRNRCCARSPVCSSWMATRSRTC
ncbi:hypothetical protein [Amycolatopsis sp. NPDC050768]|uniref:hypothetical protein n=1 Tax=Amycolatopsis sp. NPDC050768 TaxID=3154839 RepID=UPI0033FBD264